MTVKKKKAAPKRDRYRGPLKPCPLCGRKAHIMQPHSSPGQPWNVACGDEDGTDTCGLVLYGDYGVSKAEMMRRWNKRAKS